MNIKTILVFFASVFIFILLIPYLLASPQPDEQLSEVIGKPDVEYQAEGLRDPFEEYIKEKTGPLVQPQVSLAPPPLTIQGIIWGGRFPQAIINNKVVKVGDTIEGARIIEISKDSIIVFYGNREYNLSSPAATQLKDLRKEPKGGKP